MFSYQQIHAHKPLFGNQGKLLNLGHLDFDIVLDLDIRISDFNHSGCFIQNEPNFRKSQMNVTIYSQMAYENKWQRTLGENEPNTNPNEPNQSQFAKCQNECKLTYNKGL